LESQQNDNIPRSAGETSLKQEKLQMRSKSTKCYIHFHNFPESSGKKLYCFTYRSVADSENQIKKGHRNLESQQNDNIPRSAGETSLKQEKLQKRSKSTKCYIHFHNFPESSAKNLMLFHIYKCRSIRKSNQNRALELGIPAEWQHSKVSRRNVTQTRKSEKTVKINQMFSNFGINQMFSNFGNLYSV